MRILLIDNAVDTHSERFLSLLLEAGHTVGCVSIKDRLVNHHRNYFFFPYPLFPRLNNIRPYYLGKFLRDSLSGIGLRRIWRGFQPDVTHVLLISPNTLHCVRGAIQPLVLTAFGSDINDLFGSKASELELRRRVRRALQFAKHVTADSAEILQRCDMLAGKTLESSIFYFGIDLELFKPATQSQKAKMRYELGIPASSKIILSPRRIIPKMRHDLVVKAFAKLIKKQGMDAILVLRKYGSYSPEYERSLKDWAHQLGIGERLLWLDQMDYEKIPALYGLADVVINVPEQDGLPVALFEASACMVPVITSELSAYKDFLCRGSYFRVPVGNYDAVASMIEFILTGHSEQVSDSIQKNYKLICQEADMRKSIFSIEKIYGQAIRSK
jgi:glycosyltransferase involved in cell wall biosynthesis